MSATVSLLRVFIFGWNDEIINDLFMVATLIFAITTLATKVNEAIFYRSLAAFQSLGINL